MDVQDDVNWCPQCGRPREVCLVEGSCETGKMAAMEEVRLFCKQVEGSTRGRPMGLILSYEKAICIVRELRKRGF